MTDRSAGRREAPSTVDIARVVPAVLGAHPSIGSVRLVGSRGESRAHELSDWDFAVDVADFELVARDLHALVASLHPLAEQWDPYSSYACYMLVLPGPTKIDLLFPTEHREWSAPWVPSPETLPAIDRHFWDWTLWLEQKRHGGDYEVLAKSLGDMHELLLRPMGVVDEPETVSEAVDAFLKARAELEQNFGVTVPRDLEHEVRPAVSRR